MTKNSGHKKRIRELMAQTGLHYTAAKRLLEESNAENQSGTTGNGQAKVRPPEGRTPQ